MNIESLLENKKGCGCGKEHKVDIEHVFIEKGALERLSFLTKDYRHILMVSDVNTYKVCGKNAEAVIFDKIESSKVFECEGYLVPDENAVEELKACITPNTDLVIGVGSGVINDLCKYVSFKAGLPYYIIATAPSMDGYASTGAAMIFQNMKITANARVPKAIIADLDVIKNAPIEMIKAGYGDIIGKYSALNDWKLGHVVMDEYFCEKVYDLTYETVVNTVKLAFGLLERNEKSIQALMEALVIVGIAMSYVGNSRPASGSEHHLSHYFEVTGLLNDEPYFLHGIDVAYSTIATQQLREKLLSIKTPSVFREFNRNRWEEDIRKIYGNASDGIIALQEKMGWYDKNFKEVYTRKWEEIKKVLSEVPSSESIKKLLADVNLPYEDFLKEYSEEKIVNSFLYAKDLKDRYTVLWLSYFVLA